MELSLSLSYERKVPFHFLKGHVEGANRVTRDTDPAHPIIYKADH